MKSVIPSHIPPDLVFDFDRFQAPQLKSCPHRAVAELYKGAPDIFFTPSDGGHWVVTRAALALDMLRQPDKFSSNPDFNVANDRKPRTLPNQVDPPVHTDLRRIVNPYFSPVGVKKMEAEIRRLAGELIDSVAARGHCEFLTEIAQLYPVELFLRMAGAPLGDREKLIHITDRFTREPDVKDRRAALDDLANYLKVLIADRERNPGDDLISIVVQGKIEDRFLTADEKLGMVALLFLGGLDTVAAMLSFIMAFLGKSPSHYQRLVADPAIIPNAVEELMRVHGVAGTERGVTSDMVYNGVNFKTGDRLVYVAHVYGLDEQMIDDPFTVDFDRPISSHLVFGSGPHRCLGSHLARLEIRVFLEEWTRRIPVFRVDAEGELETRGGMVWSPVSVPLAWPTAEPMVADAVALRREI
jgi:cytochrome P450